MRAGLDSHSNANDPHGIPSTLRWHPQSRIVTHDHRTDSMAPAKFIAFSLLLSLLLRQPATAQENWSYSGAGSPAHWGDLGPENSACKLGHEQSPIDIRGAAKGLSEPIDFKYGPSPLKI